MEKMEEYTARRLIYIKRLFIHGVEHSNLGNQIDFAISILNFDSSIEMLVYTILEFYKKDLPKDISLHNMLKSCNSVLVEDKNLVLSSIELENLRRARNDVQHHGIIPCQEDVVRYRSLVVETIVAVFSKVFGINFEEVSLSLLFDNDYIRKIYAQAEQSFFHNDYENSILLSVAAFEIAKTAERKRQIGSGLGTALAFFGSKDSSISGIMNIIIQDLEILKLGIEYKKFMRYREICLISPFSDVPVEKFESTVEYVKKYLRFSEFKSDLRDMALFCLEYSAENILRWQRFEREVDISKFRPFVE